MHGQQNIKFQTHLTEYNRSTCAYFKRKNSWINTLGLTHLRYSGTPKGDADKNNSYMLLDSTKKCEIETEISCETTASPSFCTPLYTGPNISSLPL
jgi:hypothetical protein